jgi:hypothetical protein
VSYYNFNDHFWSPETVCSQSALPKSNKKSARRKTLGSILALVCIAVWTPLLLQLVVPGVKKNQETISLETSKPDVDQLVFKRERVLFYLSTQQR